ncbi:MAG: L-rhamnose mutarotase [Ruthenibacterium sp.]
MKRHVLTIELDAEHVSDYVFYHENVWSEVEQALRKAGVVDMETYLLGTRLCTVMETTDDFDPIVILQNYADCSRVNQWDGIMNQYQRPVKEAAQNEWWASMKKIYDSKWHSHEMHIGKEQQE